MDEADAAIGDRKMDLRGIMDTKRAFLSVLIALSLVLVYLPAAQAAPPPIPFSLFGTVRVDGANVSDGTVITAWINGIRYATGATYTVTASGSAYTLTVPGDDPATPAVEGGVNGDTIYILIDSGAATQTATWTSGSNQRRDLTMASVSSPTITVIADLDPFTSLQGVPSVAQSYLVAARKLTGNLNIVAPGEFEVSLDNVTFGPFVSLTPSSGSIAGRTIYIRFNRSGAGSTSGNIVHVSSGATSVNTPVSGTAIFPIKTYLPMIRKP